MKLNFNSIWKYVAGGGTVLGYQAFYDRMVYKNKTNDVLDAINSIKEKIDSLSEEIDTSKVDKSHCLELEESICNLKAYIRELSDIHKKYCKKHDEISENHMENSKKLFESYKEEFTNAFNKAKEISENIEKKSCNFDGSLSKFSDDENFFIKLINEFKDYLSNLSITDICLVINISSSLFILTCLVTIIFAVYGNFIINKLNLEEKLPKLAIFIKFRIKLQHTYILVNTLLIFVVLILMIIINFITLINV